MSADLTASFESDVVLEGTQTSVILSFVVYRFESDVVLEGTQTQLCSSSSQCGFESDVVLEGTQTPRPGFHASAWV